MRNSKIKAKLARNEPVLIPLLELTDASIFELVSLMGFDGIWIDVEHHAHSVETAANLMRAARVGSADIIARPAKGEFMRMARLLEAGAQGIMYPRCADAAEAAEVVKWAKFAPLGKRGFDGGNPDMPYGMMAMDEYVRGANEQTFIIIQLEDRHAVENAQAIAEVQGVDILFFGAADFSVLSSIPGQFDHSRVREAIQKIAEVAGRAGKHWGTFTSSLEQTEKLLEMGARFICHGEDIMLIKSALEEIQEHFAPLGFTFGNWVGSSPNSLAGG